MSTPDPTLPPQRIEQEGARRKEELPLLLGRGVGATVTQQSTTWHEMQGRLRLARADATAYEEYISLSRDEKLALKSRAGYCVPAACSTGHRSDEEIFDRWAVWIDVEGGNQPIDVVLEPLRGLGIEVFWHTTRSHHPDHDRRYRLWLPTLENLDAHHFARLAGWICDVLEGAGVGIDRPASLRYSQPAFLPVIGAGQRLEEGLVPGHLLSLQDIGVSASPQVGGVVDTQGFLDAVRDADKRNTPAGQTPDGLLFQGFEVLGMVKGRDVPGRWRVECPNAHQHTDPSDDTAYYYEPHHGGFSGEGFRCFHAHCGHLTTVKVKQELGVVDKEVEEWEERTRAQSLEPGLLSITDVNQIPPRPWVVPGTLLQGYITIVHAPGGSAKSTWSLLQCMSVAVGKDLTGRGLYSKGPGAVQEGVGRPAWIINNEDDQSELLRRIWAIAQHHQLDWALVQKNLRITSGYRERLILAAQTEGGDVVTTEWAKSIAREAKALGVAVLCIDPIVSTHTVSENDNRMMDAVMGVFRRLADDTQAALLLVAHDRKGGAGGGDSDMMRGASAVRDAARITLSVAKATQAEAKHLGVDWDTVGRFLVRVDDGKKNFAPPAPHADWYRLISVNLAQGDSVAALEPFDAAAALLNAASAKTAQDAAAEEAMAQTIIDVVLQQGTDGKLPETAGAMVKPLRGVAETCKGLSDEKDWRKTGERIRALCAQRRSWKEFQERRHYELTVVDTHVGPSQSPRSFVCVRLAEDQAEGS